MKIHGGGAPHMCVCIYNMYMCVCMYVRMYVYRYVRLHIDMLVIYRCVDIFSGLYLYSYLQFCIRIDSVFFRLYVRSCCYLCVARCFNVCTFGICSFWLLDLYT